MKKRDAALAFDGAERISEGDAEAFKCAGCGANMRYEPSAQKIVCDHCGSRSGYSRRHKRDGEGFFRA